MPIRISDGGREALGGDVNQIDGDVGRNRRWLGEE